MSKDKPIPLKDLAERIKRYLNRFEADPKINAPRPEASNTKPYYCASAIFNGGSRIKVIYVHYQGVQTLTREQAIKYLAWLDAGNVGPHYLALPRRDWSAAQRGSR